MLKWIKNSFSCCMHIGASSTDTEAVRLKKSSFVLLPLVTGPLSFIWASLYLFLGHYTTALIPLFYGIISFFNLWYLNKTKNSVLAQQIQTVMILLVPFFLMWSLGGFDGGSFVMIWAFFAPIAALTYAKDEKSLYWFYSFIALVIFSAIIDQELSQKYIHNMPLMAVKLFFVLNITAGLSGIYFLIKYFINEKEKNATERLQKEHKALLHRTEELKQANSKLKYMADHDPLTDLPNRYHLQEYLGKMMALAKRNKQTVALLFLDLDGFKNVNDSFGHKKGDEVLQIVAHRIKSLLREEDTVARVGGDEFAIAIGSITDISYVEEIAQRLIEEINRDYSCLASSSPIGVSIGISLFPEHTQEADTLINYSDKAMYLVKQASKNSFLMYDKEMENDGGLST